MRTIYFDNAATAGKLSDGVLRTIRSVLSGGLANAGHGSHALSVSGEKEIFLCRKLLSETFNNGSVERVVFTANCTEALNFAIFGLAENLSASSKRHKIVADVTNHNSVLRPLYSLERKGFDLVFVRPSKHEFVTKEDILSKVDDDTLFVCMNAVSNVTGYKNEFEEVGKALSGTNVPLIVDGAQAGGHIAINMLESGVSVLCLAGHKGLGGTQGSGVLIFTAGTNISPVLFGGSGGESFSPYPSVYPDVLEAGTKNLVAIAALKQAIIELSADFSQKQKRIAALTEYALKSLSRLDGLKLYSQKNQFGIVSFLSNDVSSDVLSSALDEYGIAVRGGFHCAPKIHEFLSTEKCGLTRLSFSAYNNENEIDYFIFALKKILYS